MFLVLQDYEDFIIYVCKAYKGTDIPKSCSQVLLNTVKLVKGKSEASVCDKEWVMPSLWAQIRSTITSWIPQMNIAGAI